MATANEIKYLGQAGAEQLVANVNDKLANKLDKDELDTVITEALSEAKASGEFDGEDGHTPVRGTDYWTEEDIAAIKSYVDEAILGGAW